MQWQARTVAAAIDHMATRYVLGASPFEIERLVQAMYRNEYARGGPVLNSAIAAIEFALWDICGKSAGAAGLQSARRAGALQNSCIRQRLV